MIKRFIGIDKKENDDLRRIQNEYGITPCSFIMYVLKEIADKFKGKCASFRCSDSTSSFCREVLNAYTPFGYSKKGTTKLCVECCMPIPYSEITQKLREAGILSDTSLIRAIIHTIIGYPELVSRCRFSGFLSKTYTSPERVRNYKNNPINDTVCMSPVILDELDKLSERTNFSKNIMISSVLKLLCDIEFDNSCDMIHNAHVAKSCILESVERNIYSGDSKISISISDIKYSVQLLALMEKYGIPGKKELYTRVARFIIDSANGSIQLINDKIDDYTDHNDTMLIRNDYRKEVAYAASRY